MKVLVKASVVKKVGSNADLQNVITAAKEGDTKTLTKFNIFVRNFNKLIILF